MSNSIKETAMSEFKEEKFREAVEAEKQRLRARRSIFDRIFPYSVIFVKKERS